MAEVIHWLIFGWPPPEMWTTMWADLNHVVTNYDLKFLQWNVERSTAISKQFAAALQTVAFSGKENVGLVKGTL